MISFEEVAVLDRNAEAAGIPVERLMENAGAGVAARVGEIAGDDGVLVLAGAGNNGGDGLVAARLLAARGVRVRLLSPLHKSDFRSDAARRAFEALPRHVEARFGATVDELREALARPAVVVDALLGAGARGRLREPYRAWIEALAARRGTVVSVDVPSGMGTDLAVVPDETITFHDVKEGMDERSCGRIRVADIGIPPQVARWTGPGEYLLYPRPRASQHKGEGGVVLVLGGGPYTGAPAVAGLAALRTGADLAIVLTPQRVWSVVASYSPNLVVRPLQGDDVDFDDPANRVQLNTWLKKAHALVVGPGLGLYDVAQRAVHHALERAAKEGVPTVVDADALAALAPRQDLLHPGLVLTPHRREFRTLTGEELPDDPEARAETARLAAAPHGATWLVKGPVDVVTDGARLKLNGTGHPTMSVGGTGDALAGIVGALLAKGLRPFDAARLAARLCGEAGELAAQTKSYGALATDLVDALPAVLARSLPRPPGR